jgi:hypothetical protein
MEDAQRDPLEILWDSLLSRQAERVRAVFARLAPEEQRAVLKHLQNMAEGPDWHPEQRASAEAALNALKEGPLV